MQGVFCFQVEYCQYAVYNKFRNIPFRWLGENAVFQEWPHSEWMKSLHHSCPNCILPIFCFKLESFLHTANVFGVGIWHLYEWAASLVLLPICVRVCVHCLISLHGFTAEKEWSSSTIFKPLLLWSQQGNFLKGKLDSVFSLLLLVTNIELHWLHSNLEDWLHQCD